MICEIGGALRLRALRRELGAERALLVSEPGLQRAGLLDAPLQALRDAGIKVTLYCDMQADPPEDSVLAAVTVGRDCGSQAVIGLGSGSSLDTAKLVSLLCGYELG